MHYYCNNTNYMNKNSLAASKAIKFEKLKTIYYIYILNAIWLIFSYVCSFQRYDYNSEKLFY